jgi:hypothetical protein
MTPLEALGLIFIGFIIGCILGMFFDYMGWM